MDMAITHRNRKGDTYYLCRRHTKGGRIRYAFSKDPNGELVDEIPEGYEVFEHPNGQVPLRRPVGSLFPDKAFREIEKHLGELFRDEQFILSGEYCLERYCFLGGIDGWVILDGSASVKKLLAKYCKHLGKESFYALM
jgi:hypothetical protein